MRKMVWYLILIIGALMIPAEKTDIGNMKPVELVQLERNGDRVMIRTDMGAEGQGQDVTEALENLNRMSDGIIYLDTADYLLVDMDAAADVVELAEVLKASTRVCWAEKKIDPEKAAAFLRIHQPQTQFKDWDAENRQEILRTTGEKLALEK